MAIHPPRCSRCKHAPDDQDLRVTTAHIDPFGELTVHLVCNWCGHIWTRSAKHCEKLPGYKDAVAKAHKANMNKSIIHQD